MGIVDMKLTDDQIRQAIETHFNDPEIKALLLHRALILKQPEARFVIAAKIKQASTLPKSHRA